MYIWAYSLLSILAVSVISLIGIFYLAFRSNIMHRILIVLVGFAAGALLGDVFIHLLPELIEGGFTFASGLYILGGIISFFVLEKFVQWQHCHNAEEKHDKKEHPVAMMNLVGDALHNFIDGMIIAASYLVSIPVGLATTLAVIIHEIPQEIGDFAILLHAGMKKGKALLFNFISASTAFIGAILVLIINSDSALKFMVPFTIGGFLYIAIADLLPELHKKEYSFVSSATQLLTLLAGIAVMYALKFLEL